MTHSDTTRPHVTKANAQSSRRVAPTRTRRPGALLAYDGVTAAYIRDISIRAGFGHKSRICA
jgi:hypothetical protein